MRLVFGSAILLAMACHAGCKGCGGDSATSQADGSMELYRKYRAALLNAPSDSEKWQLTVSYFTRSAQEKGTTAEGFIKMQMLLAFHLYSELWLEHYPEIVGKLSFSIPDLQLLGRGLGVNKPQSFDVLMTEPESGEEVRVYFSTQRTVAEICRGWLRRLTGQDFTTREDFEAWLEKNRAKLQWNQASGQFVTK